MPPTLPKSPKRPLSSQRPLAGTPPKSKRRTRCTECGQLGHGMERRRDAGDAVHYFHPPCWKKLCRWLRGHGP